MVRLEWADPHLTWKPTEYGGLNEIRFWIGDGGAGRNVRDLDARY